VHTQQWAYEAGGHEKTGRVMEPRKGDRGGRKDISPGSQEGKADGFHWPEGSSPAGVRASVQDTTGVSERGMSAQGELGNLGEPRVSVSHSWSGGPGDQRPWRGLGALASSRARQGEHAHNGSRQGIGKRAPSEAPRDGHGGSLSGASYRGRWGTKAHGTHWREGDAGHHVELERPTGDTLRAPTVTPKLQRIAAQAARGPARVFTPLAHLIDEDFLREAYRHTRKASAPGIDGVTAAAYAAHLDENLRDLHERLRSGRYQAAPVERVWIEQADGRQRPIGTPAFEDKIVQRAVAMLLEAIYEQDFLDCSYGFRPGRSPHAALHEVRERCMHEGRGWIVEADVSGYFASIDRTYLREGLRKRGNDGRILRLMGKWLRAGVMDHGERTHPETGVVQGGVISPVLANIFLHHVLDEWFEREVQPRLQGRSFLTRCADDFVIGCALEAEAQKIMAVLPKRFARFGLRIHPTKTTLVGFSKPTASQASAQGNGTVEFLGFTHYWARTRRGFWAIKRRPARERLWRTQQALWQWCRHNRHAPLPYQYRMLCAKLRGHVRYYGMRGNFPLLENVRRHAEKAWRYWLRRRSSKSAIDGEKFQKLLAIYVLPTPKTVHHI